MIDLTPLEVRQKKNDFRRAFRGYDAELVNDFLDLVADRMEELVGQNLKLVDRVEALDRELAQYRDKEQALSEALMMAQKLQEDSRDHAEREAELLIEEARLEAASLRQDADRAVAREEQTLRQVRSRRAHLVESFRRLLERELSELEVIEETLALKAGEEEEQLRLPGTGAEEGAGAADPVIEGEIEPDAGEFDTPVSEEEWETAWAGGPVAESQESEPADESDGTRSSSPGQATDAGGATDADDDDWLSSLREGLERD